MRISGGQAETEVLLTTDRLSSIGAFQLRYKPIDDFKQQPRRPTAISVDHESVSGSSSRANPHIR